jgi:fatty acid desaturase
MIGRRRFDAAAWLGLDEVRISQEPQGAVRTAIEWPTVLLAALIYGGWGALTLFHARVPVWLLVPAGAGLVVWHSSLQHEVIHGHPTRWAALNRLLAALPLALWLPFARYQQCHLVHHRDEHLTDPLEDPESAYLVPEQWQSLGPLARLLVRAQTTLLGRLVIGPVWRVGLFWLADARAAIAGTRTVWRAWAAHLPGVALVVIWLTAVCGMDFWFYILAIAYPGTALMLLRSFAEHRAARGVRERTAIVENSWIFGPLFLFNNLHAAHHERPSLTWYELPPWYRANRERLIAANGGLVYDGYGEIAWRFLLAPYDSPIHPIGRSALPAEAEPYADARVVAGELKA